MAFTLAPCGIIFTSARNIYVLHNIPAPLPQEHFDLVEQKICNRLIDHPPVLFQNVRLIQAAMLMLHLPLTSVCSHSNQFTRAKDLATNFKRFDPPYL